MYSGIVSKHRTIKRMGIHQRFDMAAFAMIANYIKPETFPSLKQILHFEGVNGPDGLKLKTPHKTEGSHIYDPELGGGDVPRKIETHYQALVKSLVQADHVRASFEASWLAHYITDGLCPAHHYPLDQLKKELFGPESEHGFLKRHFQWFGQKGAMSTHANFEMGVSAALLFSPLKFHLDSDKLAQARRLGPLQFFRQEAKEVAKLDLYEQFCKKGWTTKIARSIKEFIAPHATQVIGIVWLLAYLEASQARATT